MLVDGAGVTPATDVIHLYSNPPQIADAVTTVTADYTLPVAKHDMGKMRARLADLTEEAARHEATQAELASAPETEKTAVEELNPAPETAQAWQTLAGAFVPSRSSPASPG